MSQFDDYNAFNQDFIKTTSTLRPPWYLGPETEREDEEIELDDTAPLPLLIGIGVTLFLGFVILILICCCCRIRRPPSDSSAASQANYQRAPQGDGMGGGGVAYPLTSLPPDQGFPNTPMSYQVPPHMTSIVKMDYGLIGSGPALAPGPDGVHQVPQTQLKQQPPHFGGVPTFPQAQYVASSYGPNALQGYVPVQGPPVSYAQSSQASTSSASEATGENIHAPPGVIPVSGVMRFPYQQQQQKPVPGQGYQYQMVPQQQFHPMMPQPGLGHHQLVQQQSQQQLYMSGRNSPARMLHSDGASSQSGPNYTGTVTMNSLYHPLVMTSPPQNHPQASPVPHSSPDGPTGAEHLHDNHPSSPAIASSTTNTVTTTAAAATSSHQPESEDTLSSGKPLLPAENERSPSVYSNTEEEEE